MHPGVAKDALVQVSDALCFQVLRLGLQHFSPPQDLRRGRRHGAGLQGRYPSRRQGENWELKPGKPRGLSLNTLREELT